MYAGYTPFIGKDVMDTYNNILIHNIEYPNDFD